jgi:hypothetical protein
LVLFKESWWCGQLTSSVGFGFFYGIFSILQNLSHDWWSFEVSSAAFSGQALTVLRCNFLQTIAVSQQPNMKPFRKVYAFSLFIVADDDKKEASN